MGSIFGVLGSRAGTCRFFTPTTKFILQIGRRSSAKTFKYFLQLLLCCGEILLLLQNSRQIDLGAEGVSILLRTGQETHLTDKVRLTWREFFPKQCYLKMSFIIFLKTHVLAKSLLLDFQDLLQLVAFPKCLVWGFVRPALLHDKKTQCLRFSCLDLENKFIPLFSGLQFGVEIFPRFPKHLV